MKKQSLKILSFLAALVIILPTVLFLSAFDSYNGETYLGDQYLIPSTDADAYDVSDKFDASVFENLDVSDPSELERNDLYVVFYPDITGLKYGETLDKADIYDGKVVDGNTGEDVSGRWEIVDPTVIPKSCEDVEMRFIPDSPRYEPFTLMVPARDVEPAEIAVEMKPHLYHGLEYGWFTLYIDISYVNANNPDLPVDEGEYTLEYGYADSIFDYPDTWHDITERQCTDIDFTFKDLFTPMYVRFTYEGAENYYSYGQAKTVIPIFVFDPVPETYIDSIILIILLIILIIIITVIIISVIGFIISIPFGILLLTIAPVVLVLAIVLTAVIVTVIVTVSVKKRKKKRLAAENEDADNTASQSS